MTRNPGTIRRLWYNWKMKQLPWRKKWLVGFDLQGNTFWEFKDALHSNRNRRIVKYSRWTHYSDVNVGPLWMQWLRHTRFEPPSLAEQQANVVRQERIKLLAAQADARWAAKPSALDAPDKQQPMHMLESRDTNTGIKQANVDEEVWRKAEPTQTMQDENRDEEEEVAKDGRGHVEDVPTLRTRKVMQEPRDSPWKKPAITNPGDNWQPESWTPAPARRRS
ncbi:uncharacterized protein BDR25DRAFT_335316 [Lindgomyces ingoldianus]|uniref:Uncharacterized protein n=1 Tax=Lindgomyces ingoldianus TaxID=673940 RepID=A0ACB6QN57_9PLEO|nr:uncharacterized protein BDR25DRAFT_335316 [Lindgomyces ingoldianus]KAF2468449.1 hypothetical protein BDR25DRAFT_335316 [Lindgomyces ingoldianus]